VKPERESQECPGCGAPIMCAAWCKVGKHDRVRRPEPAHGVRAGELAPYRRESPERQGTQRRGPLVAVATATKTGPASWLLALECGHTAKDVRDRRNRVRCPSCRSSEAVYPNGPPRRVVTHGEGGDLLECGHTIPLSSKLGRPPDYTRGRTPKRNCRQCLAVRREVAA
jgi:hypothetical protein